MPRLLLPCQRHRVTDGIVDFEIQIKGSGNRCIGNLGIGGSCIESCCAQPAFS